MTGYLFVVVPKGFFPQQDTGQIIGGLQSDQSSSFTITSQRLRQFVGIVRHDPSVKHGGRLRRQQRRRRVS